MLQLEKIGLLSVLALSLSACAGLELGKAKTDHPTGSSFDRHLYSEYMSLSQDEYDEGDYKDSDVFALRAVTSGSGRSAAPEMINARAVPADKFDELTSARARLVAALAKGAADKAPPQTARAQAMYECWMQEQETPENFQPIDIARCRDGFADAMGKVEAAVMTAQVAPMPAAAKPTPAVAPVAAAPMPGPFLVYFDFDRSDPTPDGRKVIADAAKAAAAVKAERLVVAGYTDRSGKDAYNMALSMRRAETVAADLRAAGFLAEVGVSGHGEDQSHVMTMNGQREPMNRVVSIYLK